MKRLFVDCDDTLILYRGSSEVMHPLGFSRGEPFTVNQPLVRFIRQFARLFPAAMVIIWSGGGSKYALECAGRAGVDFPDFAYMVKDSSTFSLVRSQDIVIDDMPISVPAEVLSPHDPDSWAKKF